MTVAKRKIHDSQMFHEVFKKLEVFKSEIIILLLIEKATVSIKAIH